MGAVRLVRALGPVDAKSIGRDSMLRWMVALPVALALAVRFALPWVLERLGEMLKLELLQYHGLIASYALLLMPPAMYGLVIGFLFLDQRDDGTLTALRVTPISLQSYLAYRLAAPMLLGAAMTLAAFGIAGMADLGFVPLVACVVAASPLAPLVALALASFAENKVQGFALQKAGSVFLLPPIAAYFVPAPWGLLFGALPTYWPGRLYWALQAGEPGWWAYLLAGLAYQALLLWLLLKRFGRVMSR